MYHAMHEDERYCSHQEKYEDFFRVFFVFKMTKKTKKGKSDKDIRPFLG
jgi:hypothetical protein